MRILFNQPDEFVEELKKDLMDSNADIFRRILRMTRRYVTSRMSPNIRYLFLDASYCVNGCTVALEVLCGQLWGIPKDDDAVYEKSNVIAELLKETATANALEVRGGASVPSVRIEDK